MTPEQIFDRLMERHEYLQYVQEGDDVVRLGGPSALMAARGYAADCEVAVVLGPSSVSCWVFVGGLVRHPGGMFNLGRRGKMFAYSEFATENSIVADRVRNIGVAVLGWDIPGLRWRVQASAPMSSTVVPFLGRRDQWLVCESPITHMLTERRTLAQYQPAEGDISRMPQKETTK